MTDSTELARNQCRLLHRLRVRWAEVDLQRIVFNPHYLTYIDTAFTEYWRALAIPYETIPATLGGDLYVKKSTLLYHGSARLDDLLDIGIQCAHIGNTSMLFRAGIFRGDALLVGGELVYVFADPAVQRPTPVPDVLRALLQSYETGASPITVTVGNWADLGKQASALRREVFIDELAIAHGLDQDAADEVAVHVLVHNRLGLPLATARLVQDGPRVARVARVAVDRSLRSSGFGRVVMQALMEIAAKRGDTRMVLQSQCSAHAFYGRLGFVAVGAPYQEAGIDHVDMDIRIGKG